MAVPKIELREGEELWFERWTWPDEAPSGGLWKIDSKGVVLGVMPVPEGGVFKKTWATGRLLCEIADEDFLAHFSS